MLKYGCVLALAMGFPAFAHAQDFDPSKVVEVAPPTCERGFPEAIAVTRPVYEDGYKLRPGKANATVDFRGVTVNGQASATSALSMLSVTGFDGVCIRGGNFVGLQDPQVVPWVVGHNTYGGAIIFKGGGGRIAIESAIMRNSLQDGVVLAGSLPASVVFTLRGSWIENNSDDGIQNDGGKKIEAIEDSLIEAKMGISIRPGADSGLGGGSAGNYRIKIAHTLWNIICVADDRPDSGLGVDPDKRNPTVAKKNNCGPSRSASSLFKWSGAASKVGVEMSDSIVRMEARDRNGWGAMDWVDGTYRNVVLVWDPVQKGMKYEGPALPDGVTMTTDATVWAKAKAAWLDAHGCGSAKPCTQLVPGTSTPPVEPPVEPSEPDPAEELAAVKATIADALAASSPVTPETQLGKLADQYLVPKSAIDALDEAAQP